MIRFPIFLLASLFLVSSFDISFESLKRETSVKRCCCNPHTICRCQISHKICPMKKSPHFQAQTGKRALPLLKNLGCGSDEQKIFSLSVFKGFYFQVLKFRFRLSHSERLIRKTLPQYDFFEARKLLRPPAEIFS